MVGQRYERGRWAGFEGAEQSFLCAGIGPISGPWIEGLRVSRDSMFGGRALDRRVGSVSWMQGQGLFGCANRGAGRRERPRQVRIAPSGVARSLGVLTGRLSFFPTYRINLRINSRPRQEVRGVSHSGARDGFEITQAAVISRRLFTPFSL